MKNKYLLGFLALTLLNIGLGTFLLSSVLGQTTDSTTQDPVVVSILSQENNPVTLKILNIDNSLKSYQKVKYSIENLEYKKIKAYVLLQTDELGRGMTTINFLQSFRKGQIIKNTLTLERENLKFSNKLNLSIDYVEYEDGSSWGKDTQNQSNYISGYNYGEMKAVHQLRELLSTQSTEDISQLLDKKVTDIEPPINPLKNSKRWRQGYLIGYRTILARLQFAYQKEGIGAIFVEVEELESKIKKEEK